MKKKRKQSGPLQITKWNGEISLRGSWKSVIVYFTREMLSGRYKCLVLEKVIKNLHAGLLNRNESSARNDPVDLIQTPKWRDEGKNCSESVEFPHLNDMWELEIYAKLHLEKCSLH